ncbi:hypothetical protein PG991_013286 [Apiospora marii]|uniref:YCII-related domain-containing protein n=1 Tax=Apiospora marii TaxID=335849 RepID=A0ABR1R7F4_9PEZI
MLLGLDAKPTGIETDLTVDFPDARYARKYVDYMRRQSISTKTGLVVSQGRDRGTDNTYMELTVPTRTGQIMRSDDMPGGFYVTIWDQEEAREWVDNLLIWEFVEGSKNDVFVSREIDADAL